jgi:CRP-like cAMP-binding protein
MPFESGRAPDRREGISMSTRLSTFPPPTSSPTELKPRTDALVLPRRRWRHTLGNHAALAAPRFRSGFETLRTLPLFAPVSDGELAKFAALGFERRIEKGMTFLPGSGDHATPLLALVLEGEALLAWGRSGRVLLLRPLEPGDWLGEIEMFSSNVAAHPDATLVRETPAEGYACGEAFARARTTLRLMEWDRENVREALRRWPDVALCLLSGMARKQHDLQRRVAGICNQRAPRRLARILAAMAEDRGVARRDGEGRPILVVRDLPSRTRLAELAGMARETVSRLLTDWERRGWVAGNSKSKTGGERGGTLVIDALRMAELAGSRP